MEDHLGLSWQACVMTKIFMRQTEGQEVSSMKVTVHQVHQPGNKSSCWAEHVRASPSLEECILETSTWELREAHIHWSSDLQNPKKTELE